MDLYMPPEVAGAKPIAISLPSDHPRRSAACTAAERIGDRVRRCHGALAS